MNAARAIAIVVVMLGTANMLCACDAFNNHPEEQMAMANIANMTKPDAGPTGPVPTVDYASDTTLCNPLAAVKISLADKSSVTATTGFGETGTTNVKQLGSFAAQYTILDQGATLVMVVKQTGEKDFAACLVNFTDATAQSYTLADGEIIVEQLNVMSNEAISPPKVVNAGSYNLNFAPEKSATKVVQALAGAPLGQPANVTGTYFSESVEK